jgi:hypothetical protein
MQRLKLGGVLLRFIASFALVASTYNPTGHSYVNWVAAVFPHVEPQQAVVGIGLLAVWIFFAGATWRSLGTVGIVIGLAFFAALVWLFTSQGWLSPANPSAMTWAGILIVACLLTIGLCWTLFQERVTGQIVVEDPRR